MLSEIQEQRREVETTYFMSQQITVLIVDDHSMVRQGIRVFLETQPDILVVGEAESGEKAVLLCSQEHPHVVLMDLVMPGIDGATATRQIKEVSPLSQVIILTSFLDDERVLPAIHSGALSYLLKDVGADELLRTIRQAARGDAVLHPQVTSLVIKTLRGEFTREASLASGLSERELEVLRLIADGLTNLEIAKQLVISEKTVKSHVSSILSKLNLTDRTQAAVYAWRQGLMASDKN